MSTTEGTGKTTQPAAAKAAQSGRGKAKRAEAPGPDDFERAVSEYNDCVGEAIREYERRLEELNEQYVDAVDAAGGERTPEARQRALAEANERYADGVAASIAETDKAVESCFRAYTRGVGAAFGSAGGEDLTVQKLNEIAEHLTFVAAAASGAFPAWWWRPIDED